MRSSIWKGSLSFGLLNIPVSLQTAVEDKDLHFSMLDGKNLSPIHFQRVNAETGREVPYDRIVKGYEYKKNQYVIINDADFKAANVKATQTIDIEDFVLLDEIDTMMFEKPYYLVPQKDGKKGYTLLRDALADTEKVAVAKIVIRTKQHLCAVMAKGDYLILEIMRFAHEVKDVEEVDYLKQVEGRATYSDRELKMAEDLIKGMTAKWKPDKYKDTYYNDLMKRIQAKVKAGKGHEIEEPEEAEELNIKPSKVEDLMPLLKKSLAARSKGKSRSHASSRSHRSLH